MKCPKCRIGTMQNGEWIDKPNTKEGESGTIVQKIQYCSNCMHQIEVDEI